MKTARSEISTVTLNDLLEDALTNYAVSGVTAEAAIAAVEVDPYALSHEELEASVRGQLSNMLHIRLSRSRNQRHAAQLKDATDARVTALLSAIDVFQIKYGGIAIEEMTPEQLRSNGEWFAARGAADTARGDWLIDACTVVQAKKKHSIKALSPDDYAKLHKSAEAIWR